MTQKALLDIYSGGLNVTGGLTIDNSIIAITPLIVTGGVKVETGVRTYIYI
jgi:hypothetical protein